MPDNKQLTEYEMIDIIKRAPKEIECADAYRHFMESLGELIADHFGGVRGFVTSPDEERDTERHICDNCEAVFFKDHLGYWERDEEPTLLEDIEGLNQRLTPGGVVPSGECPLCGALTYLRVPDIQTWMCSMQHDECVPLDGGVYKSYDPSISWNTEDQAAPNFYSEMEQPDD